MLRLAPWVDQLGWLVAFQNCLARAVWCLRDSGEGLLLRRRRTSRETRCRRALPRGFDRPLCDCGRAHHGMTPQLWRTGGGESMQEYGGLPQQGGQGLQPGVWPENELELALAASVGDPGATPRVMEVLGRSHVWVPMPGGPTRDGVTLDLPTTELAGQPFVPVFSSETQLRAVAGPEMSYAVAPVKELARGLPQGVGIAVNPEGAVGLPVPAAGVPDLCGDPAEEGVR